MCAVAEVSSHERHGCGHRAHIEQLPETVATAGVGSHASGLRKLHSLQLGMKCLGFDPRNAELKEVMIKHVHMTHFRILDDSARARAHRQDHCENRLEGGAGDAYQWRNVSKGCRR